MVAPIRPRLTRLPPLPQRRRAAGKAPKKLIKTAAASMEKDKRNKEKQIFKKKLTPKKTTKFLAVALKRLPKPKRKPSSIPRKFLPLKA